LLRVIGRLSGYRAEVPCPHGQIIRDVLAEIGVDIDNLPPGWDARGTNGLIQAPNRVRWAVKSMKGVKVPTISQPGKGLWALTAAGVDAACKLVGVPVPNKPSSRPQDGPTTSKRVSPQSAPNETAEWLGEHLAGGTECDLYRMMRAALAKRLPVSANASLLDDHIQNFMLRVIRRNAFAKMLGNGGKVPYSKVVAYCVNSGRTDARDMGTEPVCREMLGARTERERREAANCEDGVPGIRPILDTDGNIVIPETSQPAYGEGDAIDFDIVWQQIENVVHDEKPHAWERYANILTMKARGFSTREIAHAEGVSRNRAASMLAEARRCVRTGYAEGNLEGFITFATV